MNGGMPFSEGVLLCFNGIKRAVRQTQFRQSLVISCSRLRGEYPAFRDTLIVRGVILITAKEGVRLRCFQ